jgi:hypothetical protein
MSDLWCFVDCYVRFEKHANARRYNVITGKCGDVPRPELATEWKLPSFRVTAVSRTGTVEFAAQPSNNALSAGATIVHCESVVGQTKTLIGSRRLSSSCSHTLGSAFVFHVAYFVPKMRLRASIP